MWTKQHIATALILFVKFAVFWFILNNKHSICDVKIYFLCFIFKVGIVNNVKGETLERQHKINV